MDQLSLIIAYEQGELSEEQTLDLFSELIKSGLCWRLQGYYGRTAKSLIENDIIDHQGKILVSV